MTQDQGGSAFTSTASQTDQLTNYNTSAVQVGNVIRDGDQFVLIRRGRQGEEPQIWASGDAEETQHLYRAAMTTVALKDTATT